MIERHYLDDVLVQLKKQKDQADKAIAQIGDEEFAATLDPEANSIALIMKHLAGNMRSRWTDFLTSDGEKANRDRDREFEMETADSRAAIVKAWDDAWKLTLDTVAALQPGDLQKTVQIRGQAHTVIEAISRQLTHYASHVGQIVLLAKHYAGPQWRTLSIAKGKSKEFEVPKPGSVSRPRS